MPTRSTRDSSTRDWQVAREDAGGNLKQRILETEDIPVVKTTKGLCISKAQLYVGWRLQHRLCRPDCQTLKQQTAGERVFIPSQTRAQELGYAPCDVCHPHRYPLEQEEELWLDA